VLRPRTTLGRDLGHNAAQIRRRGGFIWAWKPRSAPKRRSCSRAKASKTASRTPTVAETQRVVLRARIGVTVIAPMQCCSFAEYIYPHIRA
jgi:hypothetical protein